MKSGLKTRPSDLFAAMAGILPRDGRGGSRLGAGPRTLRPRANKKTIYGQPDDPQPMGFPGPPTC